MVDILSINAFKRHLWECTAISKVVRLRVLISKSPVKSLKNENACQ